MSNADIGELRKLLQELKASRGKKPEKKPRKLSALNKFKKYVMGRVTEKALAETNYVDLIPVDKMRLLCKAYPIVWNQLVLQPLYQEYGLTTEEEQRRYRGNKTTQEDYHKIVDGLIEKLKTGPKDDRQHFEEDIEQLLVAAIQQASSEFDDDDDGEEEITEE